MTVTAARVFNGVLILIAIVYSQDLNGYNQIQTQSQSLKRIKKELVLLDYNQIILCSERNANIRIEQEPRFSLYRKKRRHFQTRIDFHA